VQIFGAPECRRSDAIVWTTATEPKWPPEFKIGTLGMFVGHYAASLALKRFEKRVSLGVLFLAVQFVDMCYSELSA
jgi:hypothetical protein